MRIFFQSVFLLFLVSFSVFSQETQIGIDPEKPLSSLSMDQWTGRDGLISNNLTSVNQSSSKFIWITSFNGIIRFDGVNFKLFDKNDLPFLNSNGFYKSFEDSKGNLWFTSQSSGIIKLANSRFSQILTKDQNSLSVRCIHEDEDGNIWVGTNNEGVYTLKDTILSKVDLEEFNSSSIMDIEIDDDGKIWFATNGHGLIIYDGQNIQRISTSNGLNHNTINKLELFDGTIYAGTLDGIYYHNKDSFGKLDHFDGLEINDIYIDKKNNLWGGTEQGLFKVNLETKVFDSFTEVDGLPSSQISSLCFDHENSLWLSTKKAGLIRLREGSLKI